MSKTVFDDNITKSGAVGALATSEVLGPGRLARCKEILLMIRFGSTCTAGNVLVQGSMSQDFPGVPFQIGSIAAPGAGSEDVPFNLSGIYPFIRLKGDGAINGNGFTAQAKGV